MSSVKIPVAVIDTYARAQHLGFTDATAASVAMYVQALNVAMVTRSDKYRFYLTEDGTELREYFGIDPGAKKGQKYVRVVKFGPSWRDGTIVPDSVHAVLVIATGELCKSAGWKGGPARSTAAATKGQVLSNYNLSKVEDLNAVLALILENPDAVHGGYLYQS